MNRRIAAFAIASIAVLGLAGCSSPATDGATDDLKGSTDEVDTNQSVADARGIVLPELQEASSELASLDMTTAAEDPQGTVDSFAVFVDALGETVGNVSNPEVKAATSAVHENFVALSDVLQKVVVDQDLSAASDMTGITTELTESATALQELCS